VTIDECTHGSMRPHNCAECARKELSVARRLLVRASDLMVCRADCRVWETPCGICSWQNDYEQIDKLEEKP